jgi:large subunit ribosomal protein L6
MSTSRIGRKPVEIPSGVEIKIQDQKFTAKGPKGQLLLDLHSFVQVVVEGNLIKVHPNADGDLLITGAATKLYRSIAGTTRANIYNLIHGVTHGFESKLMLVGVGYRAQLKGKVLSLSLGYSHPTDFDVPEGLTIETPTQTEIIIKGTSKELVGLVAATIRSMRGPEPYKGKGVRYANEVIKIKEVKKK